MDFGSDRNFSFSLNRNDEISRLLLFYREDLNGMR